jgi:hypothetical protein
VCLSCWDGEGGRESDDVGALPSEGEADLGKSQLDGVRAKKRVGNGPGELTSKHIVEPTFPTGVSNGGRIFIPGSTHLAGTVSSNRPSLEGSVSAHWLSFKTGPPLMSTSNR